MSGELHAQLKELKFRYLTKDIGRILATATSAQPSYAAFLTEVLSVELSGRRNRSTELRMKKARFPTEQELGSFDLKSVLGISKVQLETLQDLHWIDEAYNLLFLGPPGVGKTHLAVGLGREAALRGYRVYFLGFEALLQLFQTEDVSSLSRRKLRRLRSADLVILDEVGYGEITRPLGNRFFQFISDMKEHVSLIITSNKGFTQWGDFLGDPVLATAVLDRLVHKSEILCLEGESYRLTHRKTIF